jgi:predicted O-methyltransferase YrrM
MNKTEVLEQIFSDLPSLHRLDTETPEGGFRAARSALPARTRGYFASLVGRQNHGVSKEFAQYLLELVTPSMRTLETGSGISTLIFALGGSEHIAVAPWTDEIEELRRYAAANNIDMSHVSLIAARSEEYLPTLKGPELDMVFIDGAHAFPWPVLDWYYTADRIKVGGLMILDDTHLRSVSILSEFLKADAPRWRFIKKAGERTDVFRKIAPSVHDVAWHEQPWVAVSSGRPLFQRVRGRLDKLVRLAG